ncbi:MAG: AMP-binding protein, partial [Actinomycetota bacterium]
MHGDLVRSWGEFHARSNALAADMLAAGLGPDSKVAQYLYNCPEYSESIFASFLSGFVPVNTNYRYGPEEIVYLFDNADAEAVVFHGVFAKLIDGVRARLPQVKRWYMVADEVTEVPEWAVDYEAVVSVPVADIVPPRPLSGDDMLFLYTGGTTGMPKGVMWRLEDLAAVLGFGGNLLMGIPPAGSMAEVIARVEPGGEGPRSLVCCPLMHGTGQFSSFINFATAGCVITLPNRNLDPGAIWSTTQNRRVNAIVVVGQAFTGPMLDHLNDNPGAYDLSSVVQMGSSGVMWSQENKEGLLEHIPQMVITDSFGSSEAVGMGASVSTKGAPAKTAQFALG